MIKKRKFIEDVAFYYLLDMWDSRGKLRGKCCLSYKVRDHICLMQVNNVILRNQCAFLCVLFWLN